MTKFPDLVKEWDYERNNELDIQPNNILCGSSKKTWWICSKCGHRWNAQVYSRTHGHGCPECAKAIRNKSIMKAKTHVGVNDLASRAPELLQEWDYQRNDRYNPTEIAANSQKKVWWRCKRCGYEWQSTVINRVNGSRCPRCMRRYHTSYSEQAVYYYVKRYFKNAINGYSPEWLDSKTELDIFIPELSLGIEYDGEAFHSKKTKVLYDTYKAKKLADHGISLVRIREQKLEELSDGSFLITTGKPTRDLLFLEKPIEKLFKYIESKYDIKIEYDISISRDYDEIIHSVGGLIKKRSLGVLYPIISSEWNYNKNGTLNPFDFKPNSSIKVWWKCSKCGYEWRAVIGSRTSGHGCPVCSGKKPIIGKNDLNTLHPEIAKEWSEKNGSLKPNEVLSNSGIKVWWRCSKCGYEWESTVYNRITNKSGCPNCSLKRQGETFRKNRIKERGSFAENYPDLLVEWDYDKNDIIIDPHDITSSVNVKVWWKCSKCGNKWQAFVSSRIKGKGCPKCAKNHKYSVPVICVETGHIYSSINSAHKDMNISYDHIVQTLKGIKDNAGGYHWCYFDDKS